MVKPSIQIHELGGLVTLERAGELKGTSAIAVRRWFQYHKKTTYKCGKTILVSREELATYHPRGGKVAK